MPEVDALSERPGESLWETGVTPLLSGSGFFLLGTSDLLKRFLPQTSLAQGGISWLMILLTAATFAAGGIWSRRFIRARTASPHAHTEFKSCNWLLLPTLLVPLVLVPLVISYAFTSYGRQPAPYQLEEGRLVMPGFAVMIAALAFYYGHKRKVPVLLAYGTYLMSLALLIWWLPLSPTERSGLLLSGVGGPLAVLGAMRLRSFLRVEPK